MFGLDAAAAIVVAYGEDCITEPVRLRGFVRAGRGDR